ncbi:MAG: FAD-dependent oxidoreductase [Thermoleophilia bacterium]
MDAAVREFVVVGSGAGGASVALGLAKRGRQVTVLERGVAPTGFGTFAHAARFYDVAPLINLPRRSREGVILWRALTRGGSTVAACGNLNRSLGAELAAYGIDLNDDLTTAEGEFGVAPWAVDRLSPGGRLLMQAAECAGTPLRPMPKAINLDRCSGCGLCVLGCATGAKWTAAAMLDQAVGLGVEVVTGMEVTDVIVRAGRAAGVRGRGSGGPFELGAASVILAAGGLATPILLQRAGVREAGGGLFADLFVNVYGRLSGDDFAAGQTAEPVMSLVHLDSREGRGFILSPFVNQPRRVRFLEAGVRGFALARTRTLGVMVKTTDDGAGRVPVAGRISKPVTVGDRRRLDEGAAAARRILEAAGVSPHSVLISSVQGAHPGGTAAIGRVVDEGLSTGIPGLFVCDASVLPSAPGLPPILTIVALARRLARTLAD